MATKWIPATHYQGKTSHQAHADLPEGTYEREFSKDGFFGPAAHMYHTHPPTGWVSWEGPLKPRAFDLGKVEPKPDCPWQATSVLKNAHCHMRMWHTSENMDHLVRNADGDELLFIHTGTGSLFCDYGHLSFRDGDYIMLPRGTMWRLEVKEPTSVLMIEATNSSYTLPDKGIMGPHAIFDPAVLEIPQIDDAFEAQKDENTWEVKVKHTDRISTITYPFNPLDAVGWKGDLAPAKLNWRDIRPLMSHRYHVPPSAHTTFVGGRFVVCTFVPRPFETDEDALKIPFFHNNDDFDEVLFYHAGDFFSRDNIHPGMLTFHPAGFTHGPHPGALKHMLHQSKPATEEVAVMVDTRDPLNVGDDMDKVEWTGYVDSWKPKEK